MFTPCEKEKYGMKELLKKILYVLRIAITKNQKYDLQTRKVIKAVCKDNTNCIDIGCHRGDIMDLMLRFAPEGQHYGFEPLPHLYEFLKEKYKGTDCIISDVALSNVSGKTSFNYVVSNPSYSGIKKRVYDRPDEKDTVITVKTELLDNILPKNYRAGLIKIDVEGAEMQVLQGAIATIEAANPIIIFEHGLDASDIYGTTPEMVYTFFEKLNYNISLLKDWLATKAYFSKAEFETQYYKRLNHYFIAWPKKG